MYEQQDEPVIPRFASDSAEEPSASGQATATDEQPVVPRFTAGTGFTAGADGAATTQSQWSGRDAAAGTASHWSASDEAPVASRRESEADDDSVIVIMPEDVVTPDTAERVPRHARADQDDEADMTGKSDAAYVAEPVADEADEPAAAYVADEPAGAYVAEPVADEADEADLAGSSDQAAPVDDEPVLVDDEVEPVDDETETETDEQSSNDAELVSDSASASEPARLADEESDEGEPIEDGAWPIEDGAAPLADTGSIYDAEATPIGAPEPLTADETDPLSETDSVSDVESMPVGDTELAASPSEVDDSVADPSFATASGDRADDLAADSDRVGVRAGVVTDERWREIMVGFVDDPRASVQAAATLVEDEVAAYVAKLAERQQAMRGTWGDQQDADTEVLRVALRSYRDFREKFSKDTGVLGG